MTDEPTTGVQEKYSKPSLVLSSLALCVSIGVLLVTIGALIYTHKAFVRDYEHAIVVSSESSDELKSMLTHNMKIKLTYCNESKYAVGYRVIVESDGFGVYWPDCEVPSKLLNRIWLDDATILVPPNGEYTGEFLVLHAQEPPARGELRIIINKEVQGTYCYAYDKKEKAYIYLQD